MYCGLGRTGTLWASDGLADVLVTGKALGGGLPISACLMRPEHADAWPRGPEDVYTHTHTGNPLAAAAALVVLDRIPALLDCVREAGRAVRGGRLARSRAHARKVGDSNEAYRRGVIVVPGEDGAS